MTTPEPIMSTATGDTPVDPAVEALSRVKDALDRALHNQYDGAKYHALMVAEANIAVAVATIKAGS